MEGSPRFEKNDKFLSELTKEQQEAKRDEMQELINMMRVHLNVDQNGAIRNKEVDGKAVYPTQQQYEEALLEIERLIRKVERKNIDEKLISNLHRIILMGGKKIAEFLSTDFKEYKKGLGETFEEMIKNDDKLQLEVLKKVGKKYGEDEINLKRIQDQERIEELEYKDY